MHGHGMAGASGSVNWLRSFSAERIHAVILILILACICGLSIQEIHPTIITETIIGTVTSGTDAIGVFGNLNTDPADDDYTSVYTTDDTLGTQVVLDDLSGQPDFSGIVSNGTSNPTTGTVTIDVQIYGYNDLPNNRRTSGITRNIG
jgi:hypothetical protein